MPSIFSRIVSGELPSYRLAEDSEFLAFLDIRPLNPGHALVIPKQEIDHFFDLNSELLGRILLFAKPIADAIQEVTGCDRIAAAVAGFDVPHAHLHLLPANTMADLDFARAKPADPEELQAMAQKIREALGR